MDPMQNSKYMTFHKGQKVYREGQQGSVAYMLKSGRVTLVRITKNKRVILARIQPGQVFGEEGLLTGEKRLATAEVDEPTELIVLDQDLFQTLLLKSPGPIQRLTRYLMERVQQAQACITEQVSGNMFLSVCGVLELLYRLHVTKPKSARGANFEAGVSYVELSKTLKDILLITQLEIDEAVSRLAKLKIVEVTEARESVMKPDALGRMRKASDFLRDRYVRVTDLSKFMSQARGLSQETEAKIPFTESLEFIDIYDFAKQVNADPELLFKKMGYKEVPETYFFFHRPTVMEWATQMGEEFFQRVKRKRVRPEDLETVNDIVFIDNATLQEAFSELGFHKLAILVRMAGEETRTKIFANLSKKMSAVVKEQSGALEDVDDMEAADAEDELIELIKRIKGIAK